MAKTLKLTIADRINDAVFILLLRVGIKIGNSSLLTVRGRKSGKLYTIPVVLIERDGQRWLVAPYGVVQWVRNIRAAGTATLARGRHSETIAVTEVSTHEAAPVLKEYLTQIKVARPYFDVTIDSPLEDFEREAPRHPVFKITTVEVPSQ